MEETKILATDLIQRDINILLGIPVPIALSDQIAEPIKAVLGDLQQLKQAMEQKPEEEKEEEQPDE